MRAGLLICCTLLAGCSKSGFSHVVHVENERHFIGEYLKFSGSPLVNGVRRDAEAQQLDLQIDQGDGPRKGRLRWVECLSGPDCDEAGMY